jgi:hypothetical protein
VVETKGVGGMFKAKLNEKFAGAVVKAVTEGPDYTQVEFEGSNDYLFVQAGNAQVMTVTSR